MGPQDRFSCRPPRREVVTGHQTPAQLLKLEAEAEAEAAFANADP